MLAHTHAAAAQAGGCPNANIRPNATNAAAVDTATLCLIDQIRAADRLRSLRANSALGRVAVSQVSSMVRTDYFADNRPTGQTPMSLVVKTPYRAHAATLSVGQNIAWGTGRDSTPKRIVAQWMASRSHREVMLDSEYHDIGIAVLPALPRVLRAGRHGAVYAVEFGVRR
ncbi:MAG: CAP domain-containing protein [Solirubrobacteraceae bacterium]